MSEGLWWRKVRRGIIRDDHLEQVAYALPKRLRPLVITWYMVAYMIADDDGMFNYEDGSIFALRCFSSLKDVSEVKDEMEKKGIIQNVMGGHCTRYIIKDWIEVEDGSKYNARPSMTQEQRREKVAQRIKAEQADKARTQSNVENVKKEIGDYKKGVLPVIPPEEPLVMHVVEERLESQEQLENEIPPAQSPASLAALAASLAKKPQKNNVQNDSSTKIGETSKQTQDSTRQDKTGQYKTREDKTKQNKKRQHSTKQDSLTEEYKEGDAAVAADMLAAVAANNSEIQEASSLNLEESVKNSHFEAIFNGLTHFFSYNLPQYEEKSLEKYTPTIEKITNKLLSYVSNRNNGAMVVSLFLSVMKSTTPEMHDKWYPDVVLQYIDMDGVKQKLEKILNSSSGGDS